jgi:hypothetical protein
VTLPPLPTLADPEQFISCGVASGVLPSGVCFHWLSFCWLAGVCAHAPPTQSPITTNAPSHPRLIPLLDDIPVIDDIPVNLYPSFQGFHSHRLFSLLDVKFQ